MMYGFIALFALAILLLVSKKVIRVGTYLVKLRERMRGLNVSINDFKHHVSLIVMEILVNVVVLTDVNSHSSLLVTILKPNFQSKEEVKAVKKSSLSKKEIQTVLHSPVSIQIFLYKQHMPF